MQPSISSRQIGIWRLQWFQIFNKATATIPIMRHFLIPALLLLATSGFAQNEPRTLLYLTDGSFLKGTIEDTLPDAMLQVRLTDGSKIEVSQSLLWQVREISKSDQLLPDGRKMLEKGGYSLVGFQTLSARRISNWDNSLRWGLGVQYSAGYQFSPRLAVGAGIGLDSHEFFFMPVFLEARGSWVNMNALKNRNRPSRWFGKSSTYRRRVPLCYSLQLGYNLPVEEVFSNNADGTKIKGAWMAYPAIGLLFPSRSGTTFRLDAGYKLQAYRREYSPRWDETYRVVDKVLLKSFALRAGWIF
jgi:hypothetical protein